MNTRKDYLNYRLMELAMKQEPLTACEQAEEKRLQKELDILELGDNLWKKDQTI